MSEQFLRLTEAPLERGLPLEERVRRYRLRFITPVRQPAVLISQVQRSGGTLMSQLLDGHSELHVHPLELHIGRPDKHVWPDLSPPLGASGLFENLREVLNEKLAETGYHKMSKAERLVDPMYEQDVLPFMFSPELQREIFVALIERWRPSDQRGILDAYVTSYFNAWVDYQGLYRPHNRAKYWAVFVPRVTAERASFQRFVRDYPDGKMITIVRDPVSWFASAQRHSGQYKDVRASAELWRTIYGGVLANYQTSLERFLFVAFEDMVSDTQTVMRRVCTFLGIQFEPCLLYPTFNGFSIKSDSSFGARHGIDRGAADRRDKVSDQEAAVITDVTSDVYARLRQLVARS